MMKQLYRKCTSYRALVNIALALCLAAITSFSACDTDNTTRFSHHRAFLRFAPVAAVPTLSAAVRGVGEWCAITYDASHYIIRKMVEKHIKKAPNGLAQFLSQILAVG